MKNALIVFCLLLLTYFTSFGQCEVKSLMINDNYTRYSMLEQFYQNEDLENGMKTVYVYANAFKDVNTKKTLLNTLVITYIYSSYQPAFTAGKITINFSDGNNLILNATKKSTNTANEVPVPERMKTIECIFELSVSDITKIIGSDISSLYISDTREGGTLDITPKYKSLLIEMFNCVNN